VLAVRSDEVSVFVACEEASSVTVVLKAGRTVLPEGALSKYALTVAVSPPEAAFVRKDCVTTVVAAVPTIVELDAVDTARVSAKVDAFAETAERPPRVNAAAATSATRLKLVFVDIIFLSEKVEPETFSDPA